EPVFAPLWKRSVQQIDLALGEKVQIVRWEENLLSRFDAVVAYGSDQTIAELQAQVSLPTRFVGYGHKFSAAVIWKEALAFENRAALAAQIRQDVAPFNLQGCLSPQTLYVEGEDPGVLEILLADVQV